MAALNKAPFPWFGGKSKAAPLVWQLLGDVDHYVEPFAGSLAVLLNRPHPCNRTYFSETVNDLDGFVVNAWRGIQLHPDETAEAASWPVTEADKTARQIRLLKWREENDLERLMGDPEWCDPVMAGWWLWAVSVQIGAFTGDGAWTADPVTGRIIKQDMQRREPGVTGDRPHLGNNGVGVNHADLREPGVSHEPGDEFHPVTMPELIRWFRYLAARLRHVRIVNGDWTRVVTNGAMKTIGVRQGGHAGIFVDPPYDPKLRTSGLYAEGDSHDVSAAVRSWAKKWGDDPQVRIVIAGFDTEHDELLDHGWTVHEWFKEGWLTGGMGNTSQSGGSHRQHLERLWASPACVRSGAGQLELLLG